MNRYKKFRVDTTEAVAAACAVYRHLGNTVKKAELNDTSKTSKELLLDHFSGNSEITITDEDRGRAVEVASYIQQRNMLDKLAGRSNSPFFLSVAVLLEKETVSSSDFGILAWAPKLVGDLTAADEETQNIRQTLHDSTHIGTLGKGIELEFHVLKTNYLKNYNSFVVLGHDGFGNSLSYWSARCPESLVFKIKARVKKHETLSRYGNAKSTVINYVKLKK